MGTLISAREGVIRFETPFAGELSVTVANVQTMYTERPVVVFMANGRVLRGQRMAARENVLVMLGPDNQAKP